jgi:hypothetical protein
VLNIRTATKDDLEFLLSLVPRLSEMGLPPFRQEEALQVFTRELLQKTVQEAQVSSFILIAEQDLQRLGFVQVEEDKEFFSWKTARLYRKPGGCQRSRGQRRWQSPAACSRGVGERKRV